MNQQPAKVFIVVPTYNERENVKPQFQCLGYAFAKGFDVYSLVVGGDDDGHFLSLFIHADHVSLREEKQLARLRVLATSKSGTLL